MQQLRLTWKKGRRAWGPSTRILLPGRKSTEHEKANQDRGEERQGNRRLEFAKAGPIPYTRNFSVTFKEKEL